MLIARKEQTLVKTINC